jgi:hypothetical protein
MKTKWAEIQPPLSDGELAHIGLSRYAHYPELLFINVIVQRGTFWHTALLQLHGGKVIHSSVNPTGFTREEQARTACEQEHYRIQQLFKLALPGFDIQPAWFE